MRRNTLRKGIIGSCWAPRTKMSPRVARAAHAQTPASMRSGIARWSNPHSRSTPSTVITRSVCTEMSAPIFWRIAMRSVISGSIAAFRSVVRPGPAPR